MSKPTITIPSSIAIFERMTGGRVSNVSNHIRVNGESDNLVPVDPSAEVQRLAVIANPIQRAQECRIAAKRLGVNPSDLKAAIKEETGRGGQGRPLSLPEPDPWPEPVTGDKLLSDLIAAIRRYMVMDENEIVAVALWIVHCHAFEEFNIAPRLAITSPEKRCGKTTLLDIIGALVPRRLFTVNIGAAAVFRAIELARPTLLVDEADTFLSGNDELRGILNSGHRKNGSTIRCVGEGFEPREFSTWAPVAIALIGKLPDTLEDRSIPVRLRRKRTDEQAVRLRIDHAKEFEFQPLAQKMARWAADHEAALAAADPEMPPVLHDRAQDNWRPLIAIADLIGGKWPEKVRRVAEGIAVAASEDWESAGPLLLADIKEIFQAEKTDRLSSQDLLGALVALEDRPWAEWKNGRPMTKPFLARRLGEFGIPSEQIRFGSVTLKGYHLHRFEDAFARYLPQKNETTKQANNDGPFMQNQNETRDVPVSLSKCEKPLRHSDCFDVSICEAPQEEEEGSDTPLCAACGSGGELLECSASGLTALLHRECIDPWERQQVNNGKRMF